MVVGIGSRTGSRRSQRTPNASLVLHLQQKRRQVSAHYLLLPPPQSERETSLVLTPLTSTTRLPPDNADGGAFGNTGLYAIGRVDVATLFSALEL